MTYAGESFLTGDEIADAVLAYARALAERATAATIEIPIRHEDGSSSQIAILIGPASQIVAEPAAADGEELVDADLVDDLRRRARVTEAPQAAMLDPEADGLHSGLGDI